MTPEWELGKPATVVGEGKAVTSNRSRTGEKQEGRGGPGGVEPVIGETSHWGAERRGDPALQDAKLDAEYTGGG